MRGYGTRTTCGAAIGFRVCMDADRTPIAGAATHPAPDANSIGMRFAVVQPGVFDMGSPPDETGRNADEIAHKVRLTKSFYIGKFPVTRGEFKQFVRATHYKTEAERLGYALDWNGLEIQKILRASWENPGFPQSDDDPVVNVCPKDAEEFCRWLSARGKGVPTPERGRVGIRLSSRNGSALLPRQQCSCGLVGGLVFGEQRRAYAPSRTEAAQWMGNP